MNLAVRAALTAMFILFPLAACERRQSDYRPSFSAQGEAAAVEYSFAVHPLYSPERLDELYEARAEA